MKKLFPNSRPDRELQRFQADCTGQTAVRVLDIAGVAAANALLTLKFYELTGVDVPSLDIITKNNLSPLTDNNGDFITGS